jgi:hypothetical protein
MRRMLIGWIAFVAALAVVGFLSGTASAQSRSGSSGPTPEELEDLSKDLGMNPAQCEALQRQIDDVVSVYQSGMSDDEKIAKLSALWGQAAASMRKSGEKDPDVGATAGQYLTVMEDLVAMAKAQSGSDKDASVAARNALTRLKGMSQNYVKMMKILCPKLSLPPIMNQ